MVQICKKAEWCIKQHISTNHLYDDYLPYEYHLRSVVEVHSRFEQLLSPGLRENCRLACWGHDVLEDTRNTYNDVKTALGEAVAEIIYAVTNEKGKNRKERANERYYEGIRNTPGAVFVKLCDRIANVEYSIKTRSRMADLYEKENPEFLKKLEVPSELNSMIGYLNSSLERRNFKMSLVK
jgi:(p)ppGpp synthase/HD superfamily hydrolase